MSTSKTRALDREQADQCDAKPDPEIPSKKKLPKSQSCVGEEEGLLANAGASGHLNSEILSSAVTRQLFDAVLPPLRAEAAPTQYKARQKNRANARKMASLKMSQKGLSRRHEFEDGDS
jgi:hypothetical protein